MTLCRSIPSWLCAAARVLVFRSRERQTRSTTWAIASDRCTALPIVISVGSSRLSRISLSQPAMVQPQRSPAFGGGNCAARTLPHLFSRKALMHLVLPTTFIAGWEASLRIIRTIWHLLTVPQTRRYFRASATPDDWLAILPANCRKAKHPSSSEPARKLAAATVGAITPAPLSILWMIALFGMLTSMYPPRAPLAGSCASAHSSLPNAHRHKRVPHIS